MRPRTNTLWVLPWFSTWTTFISIFYSLFNFYLFADDTSMLYANKNLVAIFTKLTLNLEIFVIGWRPINYHFMLPRLGTPVKRLNWSTEGKRPEIRSNCSNRLQIPRRQHTIVLLSTCYLALRLLCTESESKVANLCNLSCLKPSTEARPELRVTVERQQHGLRLKLLTLGVGDSLMLPLTQ